MAAKLSLSNVHKSFLLHGQSVTVLSDINLLLPEHSFTAIIGPSGCGKSTLLELIGGISFPDDGSILLDGNNITGQAGYAGYMPQDDMLLPWLSVLDNVLLPSRIHHTCTSTLREKALSLLKDFGLGGFEYHLPWQLSGGMRQRTAFLRTVMTQADILLLDEPFANLDALTRFQMQTWLASLRKTLSQTIILVTHDIDEAIRLADTIYVMSGKPSPFIYKADIPVELNSINSDITHPLWSKLKQDLLQQLFPAQT